MARGFLVLAMSLSFFLATGFAQYGSMSHREVKELVDDTHELAAHFKNDFNEALEESVVDDTKLEENYKERANDVEDHLNQAKDDVGEPDEFRKHLDAALQAAFDVNQMMGANRFSEKLTRDWDVIRGKINVLAAVAGLKPLAR
jgi:hypothetical protein